MQNPASQMEVYNIVGVKLTTIRIDSTDVTVQVNLPKGYYIFKIGNVVRKVVMQINENDMILMNFLPIMNAKCWSFYKMKVHKSEGLS